ncbi:N-myc protein [Engraulis encrasicolus]|uniref:N-myc protein n=1 Tax=Engraulis encrasicolus TaxID=184585 RepID=UPI002FD1ADC2
MPALVTKNSDLEFDSLQPCFYPDEDDFYFCGPPSEDIWKKFELLPTPPLSPSRAALPGATGDMVSVAGVDTSLPLGLGLTDPMDWASELLLLPEDDIWGASEGDLFGSALDSAGDNSIIIQDCMWSGFSAREKLERVVSEKLAMGKSATASPATGQEACSTKATAGGVTAPAAATVELNSSISECVDPAVVFPFPVHKRQSVCKLTTGGQTGTVTSPPVTHALDDTFSDSDDDDDDEDDEDDDDDDEEEEDEEEIDVVTVEKRRSAWSSAAGAVGSKPPMELILKRSAAASLHQEQHNYAAPSPYASSSDSSAGAAAMLSAPPSKRHKTDHHHRLKPASPTAATAPNGLTSSSSSTTGSSSSSGSSSGRHRRGAEASGSSPPRGGCGSGDSSDDMERRRNHNILERQRRNDLRSSFLTLRDELPELASNHKAAKVLILKKAAEYVGTLEGQQRRLLQEKDRLAARRQQLLRRLEQAQRTR